MTSTARRSVFVFLLSSAWSAGCGGSGASGAGGAGGADGVTMAGAGGVLAGGRGGSGAEAGAAGASTVAGGSGTNGGGLGGGGAGAGPGMGPGGAITGDAGSGGGGAVTDGAAGRGVPDAGTAARRDAAASGAGGADGAGGPVATDASSAVPPVDSAKKIKVWLAGDSTMQPCGGACPCGWGSQFQTYLNANATVVNDGAGGRSIQTWLYESNVTTTLSNGECVVNPKTYSPRWQAMLDPATGMKPGDYLLIEFGINDGDPTCNRHVGTALFQTYLGLMATAAKERGAQPIFLTSTSYLGCTGSMVTPNRGFGPQTRAAATANDVPIIDLTQLSAALYTSLGLCPSDLNFTSTTTPVGKFFCDDHTHFEAAGAAQIAGVVAQALRSQSLGLAAYLK